MSEENEVKSENSESSQQSDEQRERHHSRRRSRQRGNRPANSPSSETALNLAELRELAELINEQGFTDFEFENEKIRVRLRRELQPQIFQSSAAPISPVSAASTLPSSPGKTENIAQGQTQPETAANEDDNLHKITSPIVGTFYRSPSPEADSFVKVGSRVTGESVVCIIEAMKLMNEILAETSGEIVKIYVENGQPVEYGQPLFAVKK
jgi:acetyl-CoA carboxylase biotin carboxyl carrier protein